MKIKSENCIMWTAEDRFDNKHRVRIDRISAYYIFANDPQMSEERFQNWKISIVLFGCEKAYMIEFANMDKALRALTSLDNCYGL